MKYTEILENEERARHKGAFAPVLTQNIKHNYLKYNRIARIYIQYKHKINMPHLDLLMFVYSERPFTRKMFNEFDYTIYGNSRFNSMMLKGYITVYRKHVTREAALYVITHKGKQIMDEYYSILEGKKLKTVLIEIERIPKQNGRMKSLLQCVRTAANEKFDPTAQRRPTL